MKKSNIDNTNLKKNLEKFKNENYQDIKKEKTITFGKKVSLWFMMNFTSIYCKLKKDI